MYALDALAEPERSRLRAHLETCAACRALLQDLRATAALLPLAADPVQPSPETKAKLFARIDADLAAPASARAAPTPPKHAPAPSKRAWYRQPVFAFAVIALVALLAIGGWMLLNRPSPEQQQINAILANPNAQRVALAGTPDAPNASAEMYMVPGDSFAVLEANGLAPLPADKGYQFWFFRNGDPQPSDVFTVKPNGTTTVLLRANDKVENFKGWGVTIEPITGVPKPTGPIVILGGL